MGEASIWEEHVNRNALTVRSLQNLERDDMAFWHAQSPRARLRAMELLRRINYGQAATGARLKRVLEVAQLKKG